MDTLSPPRFMADDVDIDAAAAHTIAAAMREVAACDGDHPRELELIEQFDADIPGEQVSEVDLSTLRTAAHREAFIKSLMLVAYADGRVSEQERDLIRSYSARLGMPEPALTRAFTEVASALLSTLAGAKTYRAQVVALGAAMGLSSDTVETVLG